MPRSLTQLPVEVIQLIFGYLWAHEILFAFHDLNGYLDRILSNYPSYLVNFESIRKSHFDRICRSVRPEQVLSLVLADKNDTPNQSRLFGSLFSIGQFTRLRALKCIELDDDTQVFFSYLHKLPTTDFIGNRSENRSGIDSNFAVTSTISYSSSIRHAFRSSTVLDEDSLGTTASFIVVALSVCTFTKDLPSSRSTDFVGSDTDIV